MSRIPGHLACGWDSRIVRHTLVGDEYAVWCLSEQTIQILQVGTTTGGLLAATSPTTAPDLANMRERYPEPTSLWDAVRHEFWSHSTGEERVR